MKYELFYYSRFILVICALLLGGFAPISRQARAARFGDYWNPAERNAMYE